MEPKRLIDRQFTDGEDAGIGFPSCQEEACPSLPAPVGGWGAARSPGDEGSNYGPKSGSTPLQGHAALSWSQCPCH